MDKALKDIQRRASMTQNWFELGIAIMHLCDYLAGLSEQLAALEQRLAEVESFRDAWLEVYVPKLEEERDEEDG